MRATRIHVVRWVRATTSTQQYPTSTPRSPKCPRSVLTLIWYTHTQVAPSLALTISSAKGAVAGAAQQQHQVGWHAVLRRVATFGGLQGEYMHFHICTWPLSLVTCTNLDLYFMCVWPIHLTHLRIHEKPWQTEPINEDHIFNRLLCSVSVRLRIHKNKLTLLRVKNTIKGWLSLSGVSVRLMNIHWQIYIALLSWRYEYK